MHPLRATIIPRRLTPHGNQSLRNAYNSTFAPSTPSLAPRPPRTISLAGTVPYHTSYLLLYTRDPPPRWPSIFNSYIYMDLQRKLKEHNGLINFCWQTEQYEGLEAHHDGSEEAYRATLWGNHYPHSLAHRFDIPVISKSNMEEILDKLFGRNGSLVHYEKNIDSLGPHFYVCTHGNRDCRCGVRGTQLAEALRNELGDRGMLFDQKGNSRVGEVGHVGGHKNAPNILVFPHGDWYGNLEPSDLPRFLDYYLHSQPPKWSSDSISPFNLPNHLQWRGRVGMTKEEQANTINVNNKPS